MAKFRAWLHFQEKEKNAAEQREEEQERQAEWTMQRKRQRTTAPAVRPPEIAVTNRFATLAEADASRPTAGPSSAPSPPAPAPTNQGAAAPSTRTPRASGPRKHALRLVVPDQSLYSQLVARVRSLAPGAAQISLVREGLQIACEHLQAYQSLKKYLDSVPVPYYTFCTASELPQKVVVRMPRATPTESIREDLEARTTHALIADAGADAASAPLIAPTQGAHRHGETTASPSTPRANKPRKHSLRLIVPDQSLYNQLVSRMRVLAPGGAQISLAALNPPQTQTRNIQLPIPMKNPPIQPTATPKSPPSPPSLPTPGPSPSGDCAGIQSSLSDLRDLMNFLRDANFVAFMAHMKPYMLLANSVADSSMKTLLLVQALTTFMGCE
ncbi:uncharacterized protein LOC134544559 [Bacillus rossius redtenbacheri]|uniref:uncharacterized protein LOC134544559 n=1 Tax=Bacillus rossius redtenbacheri TaxID=93214 RepID=UPI002FDCA84A